MLSARSLLSYDYSIAPPVLTTIEDFIDESHRNLYAEKNKTCLD